VKEEGIDKERGKEERKEIGEKKIRKEEEVVSSSLTLNKLIFCYL
jgi:hypothetical protein